MIVCWVVDKQLDDWMFLRSILDHTSLPTSKLLKKALISSNHRIIVCKYFSEIDLKNQVMYFCMTTMTTVSFQGFFLQFWEGALEPF